jgi:hypothetical protein
MVHKQRLTGHKIQNISDYMATLKKTIQKANIDYRRWLLIYKAKDLDKLTVEEHTKFSKQFAAWKVGNIEKV